MTSQTTGCLCYDENGCPTEQAAEMEQIAASLGTRWQHFYRSIHSGHGGHTRFFIDGVEDLMRSLALREAAIDHLSKMPGVLRENEEPSSPSPPPETREDA